MVKKHLNYIAAYIVFEQVPTRAFPRNGRMESFPISIEEFKEILSMGRVVLYDDPVMLFDHKSFCDAMIENLKSRFGIDLLTVRGKRTIGDYSLRIDEMAVIIRLMAWRYDKDGRMCDANFYFQCLKVINRE